MVIVSPKGIEEVWVGAGSRFWPSHVLIQCGQKVFRKGFGAAQFSQKAYVVFFPSWSVRFAKMSSLLVVFQMRYLMRERNQEGVWIEVAVDRYLCRGVPRSHPEIPEFGRSRLADFQLDPMGFQPSVNGVDCLNRNIFGKAF